MGTAPNGKTMANIVEALDVAVKTATEQQQEINQLQEALKKANAELETVQGQARDFTQELISRGYAESTIKSAAASTTPGEAFALALDVLEATSAAYAGGSGVAKSAGSTQADTDNPWQLVKEHGV